MPNHLRATRPAHLCIAAAALLGIRAACHAEIVGVAGGTDAPPPTLGPYTMTLFPPDDRPLYELVDDVPSPLGGQIDFSVPLDHVRVGSGWGWWGHDYLGDVYYRTYPVYTVTLDLPEETRAFYFYASHVLDIPATITAVADDGTTVWQAVEWYGAAAYFGFYQDDTSGPPIEWIEVSCLAAGSVAVGEFGIAIPTPGALVLLGVAGIGAGSRRRRRE